LITGNKFFLRSLTFVDDIGLRLPMRGFRLFAQNFLGKGIRHVDDGGIDILLVGTKGQKIRRDAHDDVHEREADEIGQITGNGFGRLQVARREMRDEILKRHFNFARGKLTQDHIHGKADFHRRGAGGLKFRKLLGKHFRRQTTQDHANGQVDSSAGRPHGERLRAVGP
jgi:hypothetical protein